MESVDYSLQSLSDVLDLANSRLRGGAHAAARIWPTGFDVLDRNLGGGFRSGELILLAGAQGLGKTTWALQAARNVALSGRSVLFFSFEHDPQTMLIRLVSMEAGFVAGTEAPTIAQIRSAFEDVGSPGGSIDDRLEEVGKGGPEAMDVVESYAERLMLHRSTGSRTTLDVITDAIEEVREHTGQLPMVFVDYLQKVKVPDGPQAEDDRVTMVVEGLKDLALDIDIPILAIVAADKAGLESGKRMRVNNLRGSSALAYEADTVLILNNKFDVVARHHLVYNLGSAEQFKQWVVLSIEKNRSGKDGIDLEFHKRFEVGRFDPEGQVVAEKLVDERVFVE
ncbi:MAG TPA: DnaB-like helicase C-terminal domain-containing protein [Nocardioidaceae bacterium]|nr:DnaB-like helicase C-terminal domain-containing protein [Nocardioidaceae bacterium]